MDEGSKAKLLPSRSRSKRSSSSHHGEHPKAPATSNSIPRTTPQAGLTNRLSSAPLVPLSSQTNSLLTDDDLDTYSLRDSVNSIKDDPFFRNYQTPHAVSLAKELRSAAYAQQPLRNEDVLEEPSARSARRPSAEAVNLPPQSRSGMSDINIAIIGSVGVGKTTLVQKAFGMQRPPTTITSSARMSVDNVAYTVSLIELDLESFDTFPDRKIHWPKQINGHIVPRMDGALLLYDVTNRESIADLPHTYPLPTLLVSCKCDNPESTRQINVEQMEATFPGCCEAVKTASNVPESARACLSSMLRAIMSNRNSNPAEPSGPRRRATSSSNLEKPLDPSTTRPLSQQSKHSRASSEYSLLRGFPQPPPVSSRAQPPLLSRPNGRINLQHPFTVPDPHDAPPISSHPAFRHDGSQDAPDSRLAPGLRTRSPLPSPGNANVPENSFLNMDESDAESQYRYSEEIPILQRNDDSFFDKPAKVAGVTFYELVDRLLGQTMSRADYNFSDIFLCLYRKFAAPGELFDAILARLNVIPEDKNTQPLIRTGHELRIVTVVAKWVSAYPGDFASPSTSSKLKGLISELSTDPVFAAAAQEMRLQLQSRVVEDDDTGWARTDADVDKETGSVPSSPVRQRMIPRDFEEGMKRLTVSEEDDEDETEQKESQIVASLPTRPDSPSSLSPSFHTTEDYEREAATMVPRARNPLNKFRFHIFMDVTDDDITDEMTRIDWVMFSSIRLRDLVRHVSLPLDKRDKCKSLTNVERMVSHFNHIAKWVANMILIRDKPKHRAIILEKFMTIAVKLRELNNYNGLAAVLAGINGTAIHRLAQTRALVSPETQKRFARLVLLMGTQKSHFAYRLAWENSRLPRIPFIPLHRRDLVSAEEGSRTFVGANGERINWKKFEVLSEVILPIMKSQVVPYPNLSRHEVARELILDCRMSVDDEDIYQRSLAAESASGTSAVDAAKKKFPWFQKEKSGVGLRCDL